jgi:hypothetical protein
MAVSDGLSMSFGLFPRSRAGNLFSRRENFLLTLNVYNTNEDLLHKKPA